MLLTHKHRPKRKTTRRRRRVDGRTLEARRYRQLVAQFTAEIGSPLSAIEETMVSQAAALIVKSEAIQTAIVAGEDADADQAIRLSSESRRLLEGLRAKAAKNKPTGGPTLAEYLATKYGSAATEGTDEDDLAEADEA
jgi:hypothetical protein